MHSNGHSQLLESILKIREKLLFLNLKLRNILKINLNNKIIFVFDHHFPERASNCNIKIILL